MNWRMDTLPFRNAAHGLRHADVAEMLEQQMHLALDDPAKALELLDGVTFQEQEPGVDHDQVQTWIEAQRAWLVDRTRAQPIDQALVAFSTAIEDLKRAVEAAARRSEERAAAAALDAEQRCGLLVAEAERKLSEELAKSRRAMRDEASRIRGEAITDAERILERAGAHAARMLIDADARERQASAAVATAHALQAELLNGIEAAQAKVRREPKAA
ncbi:MAG: hypothetical protein QOI17_198 [Gaiellales bacterium]|jgi:cell division septum initiation protein DivIVA|nr:hypothetical protein [Gaiellales bacterium]